VILFQDTDSICKRYLDDELHVDETRRFVEVADILATSSLSHIEVKGVLARARRGRRLRSTRAYEALRGEFEEDWQDYVRVDVSERVIHDAAQLAERYFLTGMDSVQLASAIWIGAHAAEPLSFSTWDRNSGLAQAALAEGLSLAHEVPE
jgi:predicted nucleic acid-binding protein